MAYKCKDCYFVDYRHIGFCQGYNICILNGTKKVDLFATACEKFKLKEEAKHQ